MLEMAQSGHLSTRHKGNELKHQYKVPIWFRCGNLDTSCFILLNSQVLL